MTDTTTVTITEEGLAALRETERMETEAPEGEHCPQETGETAFHPNTAAQVDWVLSKIADARQRAARIRENAEAMARQAENEASFFEFKYGPALMDFARRELGGGRRKSVRLYHGTLGWRTKPAQITVSDPVAALEWARVSTPDALRVDRARLAEAVTVSDAGQVVEPQTGELLPFLTVTPAEEQFYVK